MVEQLLDQRFSCVIWDEAHKIRRANLAQATVYHLPEKKLLYHFAEQLAGRTRTMLLATATPVQLHAMDLWDLLHILSTNNPQVLGGPNSLWRKTDGPEVFVKRKQALRGRQGPERRSRTAQGKGHRRASQTPDRDRRGQHRGISRAAGGVVACVNFLIAPWGFVFASAQKRLSYSCRRQMRHRSLLRAWTMTDPVGSA